MSRKKLPNKDELMLKLQTMKPEDASRLLIMLSGSYYNDPDWWVRVDNAVKAMTPVAPATTGTEG